MSLDTDIPYPLYYYATIGDNPQFPFNLEVNYPIHILVSCLYILQGFGKQSCKPLPHCPYKYNGLELYSHWFSESATLCVPSTLLLKKDDGHSLPGFAHYGTIGGFNNPIPEFSTYKFVPLVLDGNYQGRFYTPYCRDIARTFSTMLSDPDQLALIGQSHSLPARYGRALQCGERPIVRHFNHYFDDNDREPDSVSGDDLPFRDSPRAPLFVYDHSRHLSVCYRLVDDNKTLSTYFRCPVRLDPLPLPTHHNSLMNWILNPISSIMPSIKHIIKFLVHSLAEVIVGVLKLLFDVLVLPLIDELVELLNKLFTLLSPLKKYKIIEWLIIFNLHWLVFPRILALMSSFVCLLIMVNLDLIGV